jgi:CDP-diacylglycerol--serine O-phosphatidyltransferase
MESEGRNQKDANEQSSETEADLEALIPVDEHIEEVHEDGMTVSRKGVYLLPNLFTTAALFSGFYAIISGMNGQFEAAAIAIFVAMVMDGLDGRVARLTNTQSKFGEQYDSLSDMVSFGVAPALVMFEWAFVDLGKWGWAAAFCYTACAALRLARFNAQIGEVDKSVFIGLNSPSAAALVAGVVWAGFDVKVPLELGILLALLTALVGLLMVSNFNYNSFKGVDFKGRVPFVSMLAVVLVFVVISIEPPIVLLLLFSIYGFSGPAAWLWSKVRHK